MNSKVRNAVAAALALSAAGTASAFDISTFSGTALIGGGSTAIDQALEAWFFQAGANSPCDTTQSIDIYVGKNGVSGGNGGKFIAVACAPAVGVGAGATGIVFVKEDNAGSENGILPVAQTQVSTFPTLSTLTSANCASVSTIAAVSGIAAAYTTHTCSGAYTNFTGFPNVGFSDVDAAIFGDGAVASTLQTYNDIDIVFAPYVSLGLYHALQKAEGLPQDDLIADMPSLSSTELGALFTGAVVNNWTNVVNSSGVSVGSESVVFGSSSGTQWGGGAATAPASTSVYLCRRDNNSGTEKTSEIVFGNLNCAPPGNDAFASRSVVAGHTYNQLNGTTWVTSAFGGAGDIVFAGSGTGEVLKCLQARDSVGFFALGFASVDNPWGACQTLINGASNSDREDTRPIKVDGVAPSIENAASGRYKYWAQSVAYYPQSNATNFAAGDAGKLFAYMITSTTTAIGTAGGLAAEDNQFQYGVNGKCGSSSGFGGPNFDGGVLGQPSATNAPNGATASLATFQGNPINSYVKASAGAVNNCQAPVSFGGTANDLLGSAPVWQTP